MKGPAKKEGRKRKGREEEEETKEIKNKCLRFFGMHPLKDDIGQTAEPAIQSSCPGWLQNFQVQIFAILRESVRKHKKSWQAKIH